MFAGISVASGSITNGALDATSPAVLFSHVDNSSSLLSKSRIVFADLRKALPDQDVTQLSVPYPIDIFTAVQKPFFFAS